MNKLMRKAGNAALNVTTETLGAAHTVTTSILKGLENAEVDLRVKYSNADADEVRDARIATTKKRLEKFSDKKAQMRAKLEAAKSKLRDNLPTVEVSRPKAWNKDEEYTHYEEVAVVQEPLMLEYTTIVTEYK